MIYTEILCCINVHDSNNGLDVMLFTFIDVFFVHSYFFIIIYYIFE